MFTREDTKVAKGIAVICMFMHHMFLFQERYIDGFTYLPSLISLEGRDFWTAIMGPFGKICVAIFMFLGGYGLYYRKTGGKKLQSILVDLYKSYWKVFLIFVPIGFLFFRNQPANYCADSVICSVFSDFNLLEFGGNFIGYYSSYNREWWFFKTYLCVMCLGWVFVHVMRKSKSFWVDIFAVLLIDTFIQYIFPGIMNTPTFSGLSGSIFYSNFCIMDYSATSFFVGIVFAKYDGFQKIEDLVSQYRVWVRMIGALLGIGIIIVLRTFLFDMWLDWLLVPLFIWVCREICSRLAVVSKALGFIGGYCNEMWLIHTFFCYYFYKVTKIVFVTRYALVDLLILIVLTLVASVLLDKFWKLVGMIGKPVLVIPEGKRN